MRRFRPVPAVVFVLVLSALVGGILGRNALATDDRVLEYNKTFAAAVSAIEASYVDKVDSDRIVYGAIRGMLGTLDPHSSFYDPKEYAQMRERQEGRYYGLGITIQSVNGDITAASIFEGSPAFKMGIRRGDVIAKIGSEDAKGWTTEQAMKTLRGAKGTVVKIEIKRRGYADPIALNVTRDEVQILTVPAHFMVDATTGYIRHQDWGENTDREIQAALRDLKSKGMKRLLYDIRANPGGPLTQAIKVSGEFLPKGDMVVYTKGRVPN
jgi:carboxyl-terminal processing protease